VYWAISSHRVEPHWKAEMPFISKTPKPPYFAVVFTSVNADVDHSEHTEMYKRMLELAQGYDGYLGIEPARNPDGTEVPWSTGKTANRSRHLRAIPST
jgi:hypothetical protein